MNSEFDFQPLGKNELEPEAEKFAVQYGIPIHIFKGLIDHESSWDPYARNPNSSARGLGQHLDDTITSMGLVPSERGINKKVRFNPSDPRYDPETSLEYAAKHLLDKYNETQDWRRAVMNYGEGTEDYIKKVENSIAKYYNQQEYPFKLANKIAAKVPSTYEFEPLQPGELEFEELQPQQEPQQGPVHPPGTPVIKAELPGTGWPVQDVASLAPPSTGPPTSSLDEVKRRILNPPNMEARPDIMRPVLELGGTELGRVLGAGAGLPAGPGAVATGAAGAGLGYYGGKKIADFLYGEESPEKSRLLKEAENVREASMYAMGGPAFAKILETGMKTGGDVILGFWGRLSKNATDIMRDALEATKSGRPGFAKALYGKLTGRDIADLAIGNLNNFKGAMLADYDREMAKLANEIGDAPISFSGGIPLTQRVRDILVKTRPGEGYVPVASDGSLDWANTAFGSDAAGNLGVAQQVVKKVTEFEGRSRTLLNLDTLKKSLGGLWDQASSKTTKSFVDKVYNEVEKDLVSGVPGYKDIMKQYGSAKDLLESYHKLIVPNVTRGSDKIWVANNTLAKLMSAMRSDNEVIRRGLIKMLGGDELYDAMLGASFTTMMPKAGPSMYMIGEAAMGIRPEFIPILIGASPKLQGQFLNAWGKLLGKTAGGAEIASKMGAYYTGKYLPGALDAER